MYMDKEIALAKKLKEAGFPSITRWEIENNYHRRTMVNGDKMLPSLIALLIETQKISDGFVSLTMDTPTGYLAYEHGIYGDIWSHIYGGPWYSTAEIAVANLWLELKNKIK